METGQKNRRREIARLTASGGHDHRTGRQPGRCVVEWTFFAARTSPSASCLQLPQGLLQFLFFTCQVGSEKALKAEVAMRWPEFRPAFARPGFLTFKLPDDLTLPADFDLESIFARAYGLSIGKVANADPAAAAADVWRLVGDRPVSRIHVWQRDKCAAGEHGFEPSITPEAMAVYETVRQSCPHCDRLSTGNHASEPARRGENVVDCIMVEPDQWWIGVHKARSIPSRYPGE